MFSCYFPDKECSSYTWINDANRKKSFQDNNVVLTDNALATKWYRFSSAAGELMPETCVPIRRCGTHAPGWLNGKHPTVAEGAVTRQVCYHWSNKCCMWKNNIRVRNCGAFYVYELVKTPTSSLRYCGSDVQRNVPKGRNFALRFPRNVQLSEQDTVSESPFTNALPHPRFFGIRFSVK